MIYDLGDNPISSFSFALQHGQPIVLQIKIDCVSGYALHCSDTTGIEVHGRLAGSESWIDLETSSIDLTPYGGSKQIFDIRLRGDEVGSKTRVKPRLTVAKP